MYRIIITDKSGVDDLGCIDSIEKTMAELGAECFFSLDPEDVASCDGIILPGAPPDVDPAIYGEEKEPGCGATDRERDDRRLAMIDAAAKAGKPMLGICAGLQQINVYFGGTLIQDMEMKEPHRYSPEFPADLRYHPVINIRDTQFHLLFGKSGIINSMHHQAVKKLGRGLIPGLVWLSETLSQEEKDEWLRKIENEENCEFTGPCIIEGIVHKTLPIICVQWHPELMNKAPLSGAADYDKVFEYFTFLIRRANRLKEAEKVL